MTGSDDGAAGSGCGGLCTASDAGPPAVTADGGPPPTLDAGNDDAPPLRPTCASGEVTGPSGRCYSPIATVATWEEARADCLARDTGWDLASVRSRAENDFILSLVASEAWLGGSDADTEETWVWVSDGQSFWQGEGPLGNALNGAFVNWFDDEPNGSDTSDCMRLLLDGSWADLECGEERGYVCEGAPR